jgi:hypothetical protein
VYEKMASRTLRTRVVDLEGSQCDEVTCDSDYPNDQPEQLSELSVKLQKGKGIQM